MFQLLVLISSYQVNAISFHPVHGTLATVGSDGRFSFWDKDARTKLKTSEQLDQPITACCFNHNGNIFAYASSYDWSKVTQLVFNTLLYSTGLTVHHTLFYHSCPHLFSFGCPHFTYFVIWIPQGHEYYNPQKKNYIFLRNAAEELKPRNKKWWEKGSQCL